MADLKLAAESKFNTASVRRETTLRTTLTRLYVTTHPEKHDLYSAYSFFYPAMHLRYFFIPAGNKNVPCRVHPCNMLGTQMYPPWNNTVPSMEHQSSLPYR